MNKPERSTYSTLDFIGWREVGTLEITPRFQRRGVWTLPARSYFIETILRDMPVPPLFIRVTQSSDKKRIVREVIDGQQRLSSVLEYIEGKYALSRTLDGPYAGKKFADLDAAYQDKLRQFGFICEVFQGISDTEVLEIFARVNIHSVPLNAQELRNGSYFGYFRQTANKLAHEHLEFWRRSGIFSERRIARMAEVELTSELVVMQLDGLQDKKQSLNDFYDRYDTAFDEREQVTTRFRGTIDAIQEAVEGGLGESEFKRPPLFYTLFGAVYHRRFGVPKVTLSTPKKPLSEKDRAQLAEAVDRLSDVLAKAREEESFPSSYQQFISASLRQTDNIQPRQTRLNVLYTAAFG